MISRFAMAGFLCTLLLFTNGCVNSHLEAEVVKAAREANRAKEEAADSVARAEAARDEAIRAAEQQVADAAEVSRHE